MSGDIELGTCDICKQENKSLKRTYFHYDLKCKCCNGNRHFEIVRHCITCEATRPVHYKADT